MTAVDSTPLQRASVPNTRALQRAAGPPALRPSLLGALVPRVGAHVGPAARATVATAAVAVAAELALRSLTNRAITQAVSPLQATPRRLAPQHTTRTVITEWTVIERARRR